MKSSLCGILLRVIGTVGMSLALAGAQATAQNPGVDGVSAGSGSLVDAQTGAAFFPRGFTSVGLLYPTQYDTTLCTQKNNEPTSPTAQYLQNAQAAITAGPLPGFAYNASFQAMVNSNNSNNAWYANTVRFQLSEGALDYEYNAVQQNPQANTPYTDMVRSTVAQARAAGLIAILTMQTEVEGCTPEENGHFQKLPDQLTENAWEQLLDTTITNDQGVILEPFNEPKTSIQCGLSTLYNWSQWASGCGGTDQGMAAVGSYLRNNLNSQNVLLFDGDNGAGGFLPDSTTGDDFVPPDISNSAYTVHPFYYIYDDGGNPSVAASKPYWDSRFGNLQSSGQAVVITAWNESNTCANDPDNSKNTVTNEFVKDYLPNHSIALMGFGWDTPITETGYLVFSYAYPESGTVTYLPQNTTQAGCNTAATLLQSQSARCP